MIYFGRNVFKCKKKLDAKMFFLSSLLYHYRSDQPRLQGALSLKQKGPLKGFTGIEGRKRDVNGADDPESEEEK